ncbi:HipA domain-containing protein [Rhodocaloribacter sp.]
MKRRLCAEAILNRSGFEVRNVAGIQALREGRYQIVDLTVGGDAPKAFVRIFEHKPGVVRRGRSHKWPAYIAKVGHKWYPNESITEHLLTRIGEFLGLKMAVSRLMEVHGQIRFFSRYFLGGKQTLVHGAQIFASYLEDEQFVEEVERARAARDIFTFQFVEEAVRARFPDETASLMEAFVRMLAFDAIVGNNDRHHYNWGVVVHALGAHAPYFAPIYDSARALFWNFSEDKLTGRWTNASSSERDRFLRGYIENSRPKTGCDGFSNLNHFQLVERLCEHQSSYHAVLMDLYRPDLLKNVAALFKTEFRDLFSEQRKEIILECLARRLEEYGAIVNPTGTRP